MLETVEILEIEIALSIHWYAGDNERRQTFMAAIDQFIKGQMEMYADCGASVKANRIESVDRCIY